MDLDKDLYKRVIGIHGGVNSFLFEQFKAYEIYGDWAFNLTEYNEFNVENIENTNKTIWVYNSDAYPFFQAEHFR